MRILGPVLAFFWGIGQNLPYSQFYLAGIGPGDLLFLAFLLFTAVYPPARSGFFQSIIRLRRYFYLVVVFVGFTLTSSTVNAFIWGFEGKDLVEIFRPFYYFLIVAYVAAYTKRNGPDKIILAFLTGILVSAIVAYLNPSNDNVVGFSVLWNPNVIGNMLAIGMVLASLLILNGRLLSALPFVAAFLVLAVFTYSKGTWLMSFLALTACLIAALGLGAKRPAWMSNKFVFIAGVAGLLVLAVQYYDALYGLVSFKLQTTQFGDTAVEGGTLAARYGFVIASLQLAIENPVFGVGISNFQPAYDSLRDMLGANYWETDNPHSAWLYVLATGGFPALALAVLLVLYPIHRLAADLTLSSGKKILYVGCVTAVFIISGAVLLHLVTQYFLWFFTGLIVGRWNNGEVRASI